MSYSGIQANVPAGENGGYGVQFGTSLSKFLKPLGDVSYRGPERSSLEIFAEMFTAISAATPLVAGLAAYFRGLPLPDPWKKQLQKPKTVKTLIAHFHHRRLDINDPDIPPNPWRLLDKKPVIWNAQIFEKSCLLDRPFVGGKACGDPLPPDLGSLSPTGGEPVQGNGDGSGYPSGHGAAGGRTITYRSGAPSPTCTTKCGTLCTGYYCQPNPTGKPPDFTDPVNAGNCAFKTTTTQCSSSGAHTTCVPVEVCTIPTDLPTVTGKPGATRTGSCLASVAVSTCAMGPGGQPACITSTTCANWATATATTKTTAPASPTPHSAFIVIALEEWFLPTDVGGDWARSWQVFSAPLDGTINSCQARPDFSQSTTSGTGLSPGFPPKLGPFTAQGFSCTYRGTEDKLGLLECVGVDNVQCSEFHENLAQGCFPSDNPIEVPVVRCRW